MKAVVLLSGGLDSAVALASTVAKHGATAVAALSFDYGQRHARQEGNAAARVAAHYGVTRELVSLRDVGRLFRSALLEGGEGDLSGAPTIVPARNAILLSIAAGYADSLGARRVVIATHAGDHAVYPDCRPAFLAAAGEELALATEWRVRVVAPFAACGKAGIVALGRRLGVPFGLTWSCYLGGAEPCGTCGACVARDAALGASE